MTMHHGNYGPTGWYEATWAPYDGQSHYLLDGQVHIELNDAHETDSTPSGPACTTVSDR